MDTDTTSLRDFLHVVFKRKNQILLFFGVTVLTVAIGTLVMKPTYQVTSQILVKIGRENLYLPPSGNSNPIISSNREEQINSEIEILRGRFLAQKVVESLGVATIYKDTNESSRGLLSTLFRRPPTRQAPVENATLKLQKALEVEGVRKSDVIEVSFKHEDPQMAAIVVNALVNSYLDHHVDVHKTPQSYGFFQEQTQILKDKLNQAEEALEAFKKKHAVSSLEEQRSLLLRQEADLRTDLNQTLSHEAETENRVSQLRQQLANTAKTIPLDQEVDHNPLAISALQVRLVELELKEQELLSKYTEQSRLVRNVREEIQMVRNKLTEQESRRYGKSRSGVNTIYQGLQEDLFRNEAELNALRAKKKMQSAQLAEYEKKLGELNRIEVELNQLQQEVEVERQNYRLYLAKFEESRISDAMDAEKIANVAVIQHASPPLNPVSPKVFLNMVLAIFLGGFGGLGLAFFLEYLDDSLENEEDVENYLQLPALGSIPDVSGYRPTPSTPKGLFWLKRRVSHPRFALGAGVVLAVCCVLIVVLLLGDWLSNRNRKGPVGPQREVQSEWPSQADSTDKPPISVPPVAYAQLAIPQMSTAQTKEGGKAPEVASVNQELGNKQPQTIPPVPNSEIEVFTGGNVVIQLGAYRESATAERLMRQLQEKGYNAYVEASTLKNLGLLHLVRLRGCASVSAAESKIARLKQQGLHDVFILDQG